MVLNYNWNTQWVPLNIIPLIKRDILLTGPQCREMVKMWK